MGVFCVYVSVCVFMVAMFCFAVFHFSMVVVFFGFYDFLWCSLVFMVFQWFVNGFSMAFMVFKAFMSFMVAMVFMRFIFFFVMVFVGFIFIFI